MSCVKSLWRLTNNFLTSNFAMQGICKPCFLVRMVQFPPYSAIHTTQARTDLMEFFDDKKNWGVNEVKVGRSWKMEELRIKSNTDLHKLWFVLLKERNMLFTMEHECKEQTRLFPNPERIDKVNESMKNLEEVVRERNRAYFELETGESGERPATMVTSGLGLNSFHKMSEHVIPKWMNKKWHERHPFNRKGHAVTSFLRLYREKLFLDKRKAFNRRRNHVMHLLKRFPNIDREALKEQYPDVNVNEVMSNRKTLGHHGNNTA
ncbi:large ribosomal subunit protein uL29m [Bacillus rossius redtenbacheri]|uniref:large ribosomal subunit protein uL29m n=1 Tax=Bacillus rossius redtenbacheri TaxID=93214 RepID=UPI002FDCFFC4